MLLSKLSPFGILCLMIPGRGTNANVDEAMNILPKKRDLLDAMRGSNVYNTNNAGSRNLQSSFCTLGDIESDLEEDFGFYTRSFENATGVSCDTRYSDNHYRHLVGRFRYEHKQF